MRKKIVGFLLVFSAVAWFVAGLSTTVHADAPAATGIQVVPGGGSVVVSGTVNAAALDYLQNNPNTKIFVEVLQTSASANEYDWWFQPSSSGAFSTTVNGLPVGDYKATIVIAVLKTNAVHDDDVILTGATPFSISTGGIDPGNTVGTPQITTSSNGAQVVVSGTVSDVNKNQYFDTNLLANNAEIDLLYGVYSGSSSEASGDAQKQVCGTITYNNSFTCTISNLAAGQYYYRVVINDSSPLASAKYLMTDGSSVLGLFSGLRTFTVTPVNAGNPTSVLFVSSSTPVANQLSTTSAGGYNFSVTMSIANLAQSTPMYAELGIANQQGSSAVYGCTPQTALVSNTLQIPATGSTPISETFQFGVPNGIPDGNYCVSLQAELSSTAGLSSTPVASAVGSPFVTDSNGFFTTPGALIHVGNATPLAVGATTNATANPTGCVTQSDNSNYCLLAPIPGVGDVTGNLNVTTGLGTYLLTIIKIIMGLIGVLSVLMITFGGIEYMTSVSVGEKEGGKSRITNALFGLLLALSSYIILNTINPSLVNLGVTIPQVSVSSDLTNDPYTPTAGVGVTIPAGGKTTSSGLLTNSNLKTYDTALQAATAAAGVDCTLAKAIMAQESHFSTLGPPSGPNGIIMSTYTSSSGAVGHAYGLMQLLPATFSTYGGTGDYTDPNNTTGNITAGVGYLKYLQQHACPGGNSDCSTSNMSYIIAAYNGGNGSKGANAASVSCPGQTLWECSANWNPNNPSSYLQTYNYVNTVLANYNAMKAAGAGC